MECPGVLTASLCGHWGCTNLAVHWTLHNGSSNLSTMVRLFTGAVYEWLLSVRRGYLRCHHIIGGVFTANLVRKVFGDAVRSAHCEEWCFHGSATEAAVPLRRYCCITQQLLPGLNPNDWLDS